METIETKVTGTILERPTTVKIGDDEYSIAPPTFGTLILVSEAVSRIPLLDSQNKNIVSEVMTKAKDCRALAEIVAIMIIGAKRIKAYNKSTEGMKSLFKRNKQSELELLTEKILDNCSVEFIHDAIVDHCHRLGISRFFGLTTSLKEINLLSPTREVEETKATVSGLEFLDLQKV